MINRRFTQTKSDLLLCDLHNNRLLTACGGIKGTQPEAASYSLIKSISGIRFSVLSAFVCASLRLIKKI